MIWFLLIIGLVSAANVACTQERITSCILANMDMNEDNAVDAYELNKFILHEPCGSLPFKARAADIIPFCDVNKNGVLDAGDYNESAGCVRVAPVRNQICNYCDKCDAMKKK